MGNLQSEFVKEFKQEVGVYGSKDIFSIPLPDCCKSWYVSGREMYYVQGIEDEVFKGLNNTYVERLPKGTVAKRRKIDRVNRCFKRKPDGSFEYEDIKIPSGSIVVISKVNLGVQFKYKEEGYGYVDFAGKKDNRKYLYIVKKENLHKANQTALALSVKNMKNYAGMGYRTWRSGVVYLHIIPYRPGSMYVGSKILKTGTSLNYSEDIEKILNFWLQRNIIPNITLCTVGEDNLVMKPTEVGYSDFVPYDILSLGDREIYGSNEEGD